VTTVAPWAMLAPFPSDTPKPKLGARRCTHWGTHWGRLNRHASRHSSRGAHSLGVLLLLGLLRAGLLIATKQSAILATGHGTRNRGDCDK
jgi:hypothetical protein